MYSSNLKKRIERPRGVVAVRGRVLEAFRISKRELKGARTIFTSPLTSKLRISKRELKDFFTSFPSAFSPGYPNLKKRIESIANLKNPSYPEPTGLKNLKKEN